MPVTLLPASAAAFAPRSQCNVVLNSKVEPWLTATLKRINRIKRPLNSVTQHQRCLTETLSAPAAIWTICSIMLPKAPDAELRRDENPLIEALFNFQLLHIEAYVVHVDMVAQNEVAFKLNQETIDALVDYHKDIFSVDASASTYEWSEKEAQLKKLQADFVQAANRFVFRTACTALEGLEEDGAGEILAGGADDAKRQILNLFQPLLPPPPPRQPDIIRAAPILPSSTGPDTWWPSTLAVAPPQTWTVLPSSPSGSSSADTGSHLWASVALDEYSVPSPTPSYSPPPFTPPDLDFTMEPEYEYFPTSMSEYTTAPTSVPTSLAFAPVLPFIPAPLPSVFAQQCGVTAGFGGFGDGFGFDWDRSHEISLPYAMIM